MLKNLIFAVIFAYFVTNCSPRQYFDSTGNYTKLHGKEYTREGDSLTTKGYPVYRMERYTERNMGGRVVRISSKR